MIRVVVNRMNQSIVASNPTKFLSRIRTVTACQSGTAKEKVDVNKEFLAPQKFERENPLSFGFRILHKINDKNNIKT